MGGLGNGVGGLVVVGFLIFLFPTTVDAEQAEEISLRGALLLLVFAAIALPLGRELIQRRPLRTVAGLMRGEETPTEAERRLVLRYPLDWALRSFGVWVLGATIAVPVIATVDFAAAVASAITVVLGGLTACSLQYLLVERIMRPLTARALAGGSPPGDTVPGVGARVTMAWTLATGVPLLGIALLAAFDLAGADFEPEAIIGAVLFLAALALAVGLAATLFAARSVTDPLESMRGALARVEAGELEAQVRVDDGSEVGLLQAGFNRMTAGLSERERLRDAFGTFVDPSLAERVLHEGTDLAGEEVELSLLFMDVRGFTSFSERSEAREVVATLNGLYELVVPAVLRHGGHANKFIGDGLLAVFGAPERLEDHGDRAVAAGLEIAALVRERYGGELRIGVGVNSGTVVVGTIGGGGRLDFTVIGDAVNTAARVESATRDTGDDVLITEATLDLLSDRADRWVERPPIPLKGKTEAVRLFAPAASAVPPGS
ncbi:MAG: adenylate/guanylate cyclase domain-containing protein [Solirubrobacterales bacterium]